MNIKKTIKRVGKFFVNLKQEDEKTMRQSILIVDNGYTSITDIGYGIQTVSEYFPKADIIILSLVEQRRLHLQNQFPLAQFINPAFGLWPQRYLIALQMLLIRKKDFDFILLFSLDITPIIVSLILTKSQVVLYNKWRQWWSLRLRDVGEMFKFTYAKDKRIHNLKGLIKKIGLLFVLLKREDEGIFKYSILIVDNGYALFGQIIYAIQKIRDYLPLAKISVLSLMPRRDLKERFPDLEIVKADKYIIRKYSIARHMLRIKKEGYDYVVLLSLDITPLTVSILFMKSTIILNNQWYQWWSLKPKPIRYYLIAMPKFILKIIANIIVFIYLLTNVSWVFLKRSFNVFRSNLFNRRA